jgi:hypothetical protein
LFGIPLLFWNLALVERGLVAVDVDVAVGVAVAVAAVS